MAIHQHRTGELTKLMIRIALSLLSDWIEIGKAAAVFGKIRKIWRNDNII